MKIIRFLVRTRIWVALAAALLTCEYFHIFNGFCNPLNAIQTFFLTMTAYLFLDESPFSSKSIFIRLALTGVILTMSFYPSENLWVLAAGTLLVLSYRKWISRGKTIFSGFEWRKIPGLKNGVIAVCWLLVAILQYAPFSALESTHLFFLLANGLLIFALSLLEDLADMDQDSIRTLATISSSSTRWLAAGLIMLASAIYLTQFSVSAVNDFIVGGLILLLSLRLTWLVRPGTNRDLQGFYIDGILLLKSILVIFN